MGLWVHARMHVHVCVLYIQHVNTGHIVMFLPCATSQVA